MWMMPPVCQCPSQETSIQHILTLCGAYSLRSKLAHALALLRMYKHKVQLMDAASSHQEASSPDASSVSRPQQGGQQTEDKMSQSAHPCPAEAHADSVREAVLTQHLPSRTQDPEGCGGHQHSVAEPEARILRNPSTEITAEPLCRQVEPADMQAGDLPAHPGTSAQILADPSVLITAAAQEAKASARPNTGSTAGATAPSLALTQHQTLRFDPMIGECGAFVIMRNEGPPAASQAAPVVETPADVSHAQDRVLADSHARANAVLMEQSSQSAAAELAEMPRQALPKPQPQKDSRAELGGSACPGMNGSEAAEEPGQRGSSPRLTDGAKRSSLGRSSNHFEGNLLDLVAEVEELMSEGRGSTWDDYGSGSVECSHTHSEANSPKAKAMQDEICQNWIGSLLRA